MASPSLWIVLIIWHDPEFYLFFVLGDTDIHKTDTIHKLYKLYTKYSQLYSILNILSPWPVSDMTVVINP